MSVDLSQYQELYIQTSKQLISTMKTQLELFKQNLNDSGAIDHFHRAAHSLKSQSLVMGYKQLGTVNRQLEALFVEIKEKNIHMNNDYVQMLTDIVNHIEHAIADIEKSENEPDLSHDIAILEKHTNLKI